MDSYLHPEKLLSQSTKEALTHICTSSALEKSSGVLDKGSLMVPIQFTDTFMAVVNQPQVHFPPVPQQLLIIGKQVRTFSLQRRSMTGKHMVGRSHIWLFYPRPSAARQATEVKMLTAQYVWWAEKAEVLEIMWNLGLRLRFKESGNTVATGRMKHVLVNTSDIWRPQREVKICVSLSSTCWKTSQHYLNQCLGH